MTKNAVWTTYQEVLDRLTDEMLEIVSEKLGGGIAGRVAKTGAKSATKRIQEEMQKQGKIVVGYAATIAADNENFEQYQREFLRTNPVYKRYDGNDEEELKEYLLAHFERVGQDLAPLISSDMDDFWEALAETYSRREAEAIVDRHFSQAETFKRYKEGIFSSERLGNTVISIVEEGEDRLKEDLRSELDRAYASSDCGRS